MARKDEKLARSIRKDVEKWRNKFKNNIKQYHEWFQFVMGEQWEEKEDDLLRKYQKVPMVMNKLSPLAKHLMGEQRQNTPNLQVMSDNDANVEMINIRQALIKKIMFNSDAKLAYQNAFQQAAIGGFGAYGIAHEYLNDKSFDQQPCVFSIKDATKCYWDVGAEHPNKIDGMCGGFYKRMSRNKFKQKYGETLERKIADMYGNLESDFIWSDEEEITIIYAQKRKYKRDTLYELSDGRMVYNEEFKALNRINVEQDGEEVEIITDEFGNMLTVNKQRDITKSEIKYYEVAGDYILDESDYPADDLGIVYVDQNSYYDKDGRQICNPYFKDAKDAQKYLNYLATQSAYALKVARYDQFMASKANIKSQETAAIWRDPTRYQGTLIYDIDTEGGTKPERLLPPELSQSLLTQYERTMRDIESCTGMYGTLIGAQGNENSGIAIDARTRQGSYSNYVIFDSLNRGIGAGAKVINTMINRLYDTERQVSLDLPDKTHSPIVLNKMDEYGNIVENDMNKDEYNVYLVPGPSWEGQQAEARQDMQTIAQISPETFNLYADLYAESLDSPMRIELRNRLRTLVPPEVLQAGKTGQPVQNNQPNPEIMQMMQQAQQQEAELQLKQAELQMKREEMGLDYQTEMAKIQNERIELATALREQILRYAAETHRTQTDEQIAHAENLVKILTSKQPSMMEHRNDRRTQ